MTMCVNWLSPVLQGTFHLLIKEYPMIFMMTFKNMALDTGCYPIRLSNHEWAKSKEIETSCYMGSKGPWQLTFFFFQFLNRTQIIRLYKYCKSLWDIFRYAESLKILLYILISMRIKLWLIPGKVKSFKI